MSQKQFIIGCLFLIFDLASCVGSPSVQFALGDVLLREDFSDRFAWDSYSNAQQRIDFGIVDGVYRARAADETMMWALNATLHDDVVIEAEATQVSHFRDNAYGLMCRASPTNNGNGYYFLISGDGQFTIRRGSADQIRAIIPWRASRTIRQDKGINRIRIVCIGDYLALYVNDEFVAEVRDDRFRSGYAGLSAAVTKGGEVDIEFDDLTIWSASLLEN